MSTVNRAPILVTGASGFVGRRLVAELLSAGHSVRVLTRDKSADAFPQGVEVRHASDPGDEAAIRRAVEGCMCVVHLAGRVHVMKERATDPLAEFRRANVLSTHTLMNAARDAGVSRFIFTSSVKALGESNTEPYSETTTPHPVDAYGQSKLEAEQIVLSDEFSAIPSRIVVRFPLVYGEGMKGNMLQLFKLVDRGIPLPLRGVRNQRSMLYVGNATAALRALIASTSSGPKLFQLSDGSDVSTEQLARAIASAIGRPSRLFAVPGVFVRIAGHIAHAAVQRLTGSLVVDSTLIGKSIGFDPPYTWEDGMTQTAQWYRSIQPA